MAVAIYFNCFVILAHTKDAKKIIKSMLKDWEEMLNDVRSNHTFSENKNGCFEKHCQSIYSEFKKKCKLII